MPHSSRSPIWPSPIFIHPSSFIGSPISPCPRGHSTFLNHTLALLIYPLIPNHHTLHDGPLDQRAQFGIGVRPLRLCAHHDLVNGREQRVGQPLGFSCRVVLGGLALAGDDRPRWGVEGGRIGAYCLGGCERGKVGCDVGIFFFQVLDWL